MIITGNRRSSGGNIYKAFLCRLREIYPHAWIVLATTILNHYPGWDRSIGKVCTELRDPKIVHFLYQENGRGTPGHVRASEAMQMALELRGFIEGLCTEHVWDWRRELVFGDGVRG